MKKLIYITYLLLVLTACNNSEDETNYPECIKTQIKNFEENTNYPISNPKAHIDKYNYKGKIVYLIIDPQANGDPDSAVSVINEKCESICQLGGIDGNQNDCIDWTTAKFIETVWTDPR